MEETGVVMSGGATATVRLKRTSACGKCGKCRHIPEAGEGYMIVDAVNTAGAEVGDSVVVTIAPGDALRAAAAVYMVPWALGVCGLVAGTVVGPKIGLSPDIGAVVLGAVALVAAYVAVWRLDRRAKASGKFRPQISVVVGARSGPKTE